MEFRLIPISDSSISNCKCPACLSRGCGDGMVGEPHSAKRILQNPLHKPIMAKRLLPNTIHFNRRILTGGRYICSIHLLKEIVQYLLGALLNPPEQFDCVFHHGGRSPPSPKRYDLVLAQRARRPSMLSIYFRIAAQGRHSHHRGWIFWGLPCHSSHLSWSTSAEYFSPGGSQSVLWRHRTQR